jgi:geranylgeranyl diphosphate synthase type I
VTGKPAGGDIRSGKPTYLTAVARARADASGDRRAQDVLRGTLGRTDASDAELAAVRDVLASTGARATVEKKIGRLVAQGLRHLDTAALEAEPVRQLRILLRAASGVAGTADSGVVPLSLVLASGEGAGR